MNDHQREIIRKALKPAIREVVDGALADPRSPAEHDEEYSRLQELFDNLPLGVLGVVNDIVNEYRDGFMKGRGSVRAQTD